jgi:hypothetical protein
MCQKKESLHCIAGIAWMATLRGSWDTSWQALSSNSGHGTEGFRLFKDLSTVTLGLSVDRFPKQFFEVIVAAALSQGGLDVHFIIGHEAGAEFAVCCQPEAVAGRTETVTQGTYETDLSFG